MRLFIDGRWYSQPAQGVLTFVDGLAEGLLQLKSEGAAPDLELVVGVERAGDLPERLIALGAQPLVLSGRGRAWRWLGLPVTLRRAEVDVALFQYVTPLYSLGARYVVAMHDLVFLAHPEYSTARYRWPRAVLFGLSTKIARRVVTLSDRSASDIRRFFHYRKRIDVLPVGGAAGAASAERTVTPIPGVAPGTFVLAVGRVEPRKNYTRLAAAYQNSGLREAGIGLVIAGVCAPEFEAELPHFTKVPGVQWLGGVSGSELNWLYANARAFVFPSIAEGFGIPVLEALASGLPVAVSSRMPVDMVRRTCAVEFDPTDVPAMAAALRDVVGAECSREAADRVVAHYTWRSCATAFLDSIRDL